MGDNLYGEESRLPFFVLGWSVTGSFEDESTPETSTGSSVSFSVPVYASVIPTSPCETGTLSVRSGYHFRLLRLRTLPVPR